MREQSSAIVLAVGKDGLVRSADIAVVLGTGMLEGGAEWNEEAEKREESGWGDWVAEGRERALGAGGRRRGLPQAVQWARLREQNPHMVILLPSEVLQDLLFYFDTYTNFLPSISCLHEGDIWETFREGMRSSLRGNCCLEPVYLVCSESSSSILGVGTEKSQALACH